MCHLFSFRKSAEETRHLLNYLERPDFPPRTHVAPLSPIAIVRSENNERHFALVRWGFIPSWVKEIKPGKPLVNARSETLLEKPSFRNSFRRRRCLIPADGFYEWQGNVPGKKIPHLIHRPDHGLFAFAGLFEHWMGPDGSELETSSPRHPMPQSHKSTTVCLWSYILKIFRSGSTLKMWTQRRRHNF